MTEAPTAVPRQVVADGRSARRQRNIDAVLDVVLEMFGEDSMFPTMEQVASRAGVSLRSLYRYFPDAGELLEAAISRSGKFAELAHLTAIGQGPLESRIEAFVAMRLRLYEGTSSVYRAATANADRYAPVGRNRTRNRDLLRKQFEAQFSPELVRLGEEYRNDVVAAGDVLTQLDAVDFLLRHRGLTEPQAHAALASGLRALLKCQPN